MSDPPAPVTHATGSSVVADFSAASDVLLVAFSGIQGGYGGQPVFEFSKSLNRFSVNKLFMRDLEQLWYQRGLPGIRGGIQGVADYLGKQIAEQRIRRVVTLGNSMGGYAALLFGWLLRADEVHAFSPQTYISRRQRLMSRDFRWRQAVRRAQVSGDLSGRYLDLLPLFEEQPMRGNIHIYYCRVHRLDRYHATRLEGQAGFELHPHEAGGHVLVRWLRDIGSLDSLLGQTLGPECSELSPTKDD